MQDLEEDQFNGTFTLDLNKRTMTVVDLESKTQTLWKKKDKSFSAILFDMGMCQADMDDPTVAVVFEGIETGE